MRRTTIATLLALVLTLSLLCGVSGAMAETKLVYWSMWNEIEPQGQVISEAIAEFEAQNPGVDVEVNWCGRDIGKVILPALQSGQQIDIMDENYEVSLSNWLEYLMPLDVLMDQKYPSTGDVTYKDAMAPAELDLIRNATGGGEIYGAPHQPFLFVFMYNQDHFDKAGITEVPQTWEELDAVCQKLKDAGFAPITTDPGYSRHLFGYYLARMKGPEFVKELVTDKTKAMWDDPVALQCAKAYEDFVKKGYFSETVLSNQWPAGQQEVAIGDASIYFNGTWFPNEVMETTGPEFRWGAFSFPSLPEGVDDNTCLQMGIHCFCVNKNTADPQMAFNLIAHLTSGKWDTIQGERSYSIPVSVDAEWPPLLAAAKEIMLTMTKNYPWSANASVDPDTTPLLTAEFVKLLGGANTAEQFIENMKKGQ